MKYIGIILALFMMIIGCSSKESSITGDENESLNKKIRRQGIYCEEVIIDKEKSKVPKEAKSVSVNVGTTDGTKSLNKSAAGSVECGTFAGPVDQILGKSAVTPFHAMKLVSWTDARAASEPAIYLNLRIGYEYAGNPREHFEVRRENTDYLESYKIVYDYDNAFSGNQTCRHTGGAYWSIDVSTYDEGNSGLWHP